MTFHFKHLHTKAQHLYNDHIRRRYVNFLQYKNISVIKQLNETNRLLSVLYILIELVLVTYGNVRMYLCVCAHMELRIHMWHNGEWSFVACMNAHSTTRGGNHSTIIYNFDSKIAKKKMTKNEINQSPIESKPEPKIRLSN